MEPLLIRSLKQETIERPPVWLMRQAGRYLSEYRAVKEQHSFLEICRSPELAFEVSMQPMRILDPDAAIVFADILLPAEALGIEIDFNPGPKVLNPINKAEDVKDLRLGNLQGSLSSVYQTISALKNELKKDNKAVLGFAGAPWTMACYLINQGPFKHFEQTKIFAKENPKVFSELLEKITELTSDYLLLQMENGADAVQLFDSWAGILSVEDYQQYSLKYNQRIIEKVKQSGKPVILYASGSSHLLETLAQSGADCISLDWKISLADAYKLVPDNVSLQGNLDPSDLYLETEDLKNKTKEMLTSVQKKTGYIANLGHGILQNSPRENAISFVQTVKEGWP